MLVRVLCQYVGDTVQTSWGVGLSVQPTQACFLLCNERWEVIKHRFAPALQAPPWETRRLNDSVNPGGGRTPEAVGSGSACSPGFWSRRGAWKLSGSLGVWMGLEWEVLFVCFGHCLPGPVVRTPTLRALRLRRERKKRRGSRQAF